MAKFDYIKWVTERKHGLLKEQNNEEFLTYYGCSQCPEGAVYEYGNNIGGDASGDWNCNPVVEYTITGSDIINNNSSAGDPIYLTPEEYIGTEISPAQFLSNNSDWSGDAMTGGTVYDRLYLNADALQCSASAQFETEITGSEPTGSEDDTTNIEEITYPFHGCQQCPEGATNEGGSVFQDGQWWDIGTWDFSGEYACTPSITIEIPESDITQNGGPLEATNFGYLGVNPGSLFQYVGNDPLVLGQFSVNGGSQIGIMRSDLQPNFVPACSGSIETGTEDEENEEITQTYGNTGSTLDGDTCPENAMSIILDADGVSFNLNMYCVTVDGQTPQVGDIVIAPNGNQGEILQTAEVDSGEITSTGGNAIFNLELVSSGTPEPEDEPDDNTEFNDCAQFNGLAQGPQFIVCNTACPAFEQGMNAFNYLDTETGDTYTVQFMFAGVDAWESTCQCC